MVWALLAVLAVGAVVVCQLPLVEVPVVPAVCIPDRTSRCTSHRPGVRQLAAYRQVARVRSRKRPTSTSRITRWAPSSVPKDCTFAISFASRAPR
uniref:Putative secreted protein n=1 Tax=Anopheles marajoara TaxID=58244 RepID=A0A2M4C9X2_9DIPT